jgi:molecular chaperone GrpE
MTDEHKDTAQSPSDVASSGAASEASSPLQKVTEQRDEYLSSWKRAAADFINYKKDEARRFAEMTSYLTVEFTKDLLPILDSFELGMQAVPKDSPAYKGMTMIRSQLQEVLRKKGVERITVKRGEVFNPEFHEAMMEEEVPADDPQHAELAGKILEELVPGYSSNGRVIRAAKVKLGRS